jgi:hypothetical protein
MWFSLEKREWEDVKIIFMDCCLLRKGERKKLNAIIVSDFFYVP